ncbi:MAG: CDP-alcohol phosphatidyltransferase family protein [Promethearchaeota archaeon]
MVSNKLRHISNKIIIPIAKKFENSKISPNIITMLGFLVMIIASILVAWIGAQGLDVRWLIVVFALLILSGFLDLLDGGVAKFTGQKTKFGGVLDSVVDRYSDGVLIIGLIFGNYFAIPNYLIGDANLSINGGIIIGFIGLVGAYMTSYVRSRAEIEGVPMAGIGLIERAERLGALGAGIILEVFFPNAGISFWIFLVLTILMHFTTYQRVSHAYKHLKSTEHAPSEESEPDVNTNKK